MHTLAYLFNEKNIYRYKTRKIFYMYSSLFSFNMQTDANSEYKVKIKDKFEINYIIKIITFFIKPITSFHPRVKRN